MTVARIHASTAKLSGRLVLITGGFGGGINILDSAETFDLKTDSFTATGNLLTARAFHASVLLSNGRVLIVGGEGPPAGTAVASSELFVPKTGSFVATGSQSAGTEDFAIAEVPGGVVVGGGLTEAGASIPRSATAPRPVRSAQLAT